ncbi:MAG: hypothetical protein AB2A00_27005 [Myxococcota bacterium]
MARHSKQQASIAAQIRKLEEDIQRLKAELLHGQGATSREQRAARVPDETEEQDAWAHQHLQELRQSSCEVWWI